jgi:nitrite reductase/ring-hydroxylating ferredoxin subunit
MPRKIRIGRVDDFAPGEMTEVSVEGTSLVVVRDEQGVCAARNRCPHLGLSLTKGPGGRSYDDGVVQCPWHNTKFVVRTGENLDWVGGVAGRSVPRWSRRVIAAGRRPAPLTTYPVLVEGDEVFIEM